MLSYLRRPGIEYLVKTLVKADIRYVMSSAYDGGELLREGVRYKLL